MGCLESLGRSYEITANCEATQELLATPCRDRSAHRSSTTRSFPGWTRQIPQRADQKVTIPIGELYKVQSACEREIAANRENRSRNLPSTHYRRW